MHAVVKTVIIVFAALLLDLGSMVTISTVRDLQKSWSVREVEHGGILDCSLLSGRRPEPRINIFHDSADVVFGEQGLGLIIQGTAYRPEELALLQMIYDTLEPHLPAYARTWTYRFYIGDSPSINAYTLGGGIIVVNEGVFTESPSVDFIAHVVAHEIGHTSLRHVTHRKSVEALLLSELLVLARATANPPEKVAPEQIRLIFRTRLQEFLGYPELSYELEAEADIFASEVIAKAGYDLSIVARYYEEMAFKQKEARGVADGSTHPPSKLRELILRCTETSKITRKSLEAKLARVRGAIVSRHSLERSRTTE